MDVVGLGAWCDYEGDDSPRPTLSFRVEEFAVLADGRRLRLHRERGFGTTVHVVGGTPGQVLDHWEHVTLSGLERDVLTTVLPDDDEPADEHPYKWLAGLVRAHGVEVSADELRAVPYEVKFSDRLRARVPVHPPLAPETEQCCEILTGLLRFDCDVHDSPWTCPDHMVVRYAHGPHGLPHRTGKDGLALSAIGIDFCPWCGTRLSEGLS